MARPGRPRQANARRRKTTRAGRAPEPDRGTVEIRQFRRLAGGHLDTEITPLSLLFSRGLVDQQALDAGQKYAATVAIARFALGLPQDSVASLWRRLVAGGTVDGDVPGYRLPTDEGRPRVT